MRKYLVLLFGIHLLLPLTAFAQEDSTTKDRDSDVQVEEKQEATTHADKLAESKKKFADMNRKLMEKSRAMQAEMADADQEEMMEAVMQLQKDGQAELAAISGNILNVAKCGDEDSETSLEAIKWILSNSSEAELHKSAGQLLIEYHMENEELPEVLSLIRLPTQTGQDLFETVIEKSQDRNLRGKLSMGLLDYIAQAMQMAPALAGNEQIAKMYPDVASYLTSVSNMNEEAMLEKMKKLSEDYGDVEIGESNIGEMIARKIKVIEVRNRVKVGKVAPEIEGPDVDGENFKLSDYRGKVVMLDFWGDW